MVHVLETNSLGLHPGFATTQLHNFGQVSVLNFHFLICKMQMDIKKKHLLQACDCLYKILSTTPGT